MRVINILPDLSMGGGQVVVLRHLSVMAARGLRPIVAYCRPVRDLEARYLEAGIELVDLGYGSKSDCLRSGRRLLHTIQSEEVDIVQTHGTPLDKYFGHASALSTDAIHVTTFHGNPPHAWQPEPGIPAAVRRLKNNLVFRGDWWLSARTLRGAVAVSDAVLESWRPVLEALGFDRRVDVEVIYSGVSMDEFSSIGRTRTQEVRVELLGGKLGPLVLAISRLWPGKDIDQLVEMMPLVLRAHPQAVLAVAGEGPEREKIEGEIRRLGVRPSVRLLGRRSDVPALMQASDLLVFPSKNEGFGLVVLEALANGLPVVCFDLPSLTKLRRDVPALQLVAQPTVAALSGCVNRLLSDTTALAALGKRGREVVAEKWNVETSTDAYLAFYDRLLCSAPRTGT